MLTVLAFHFTTRMDDDVLFQDDCSVTLSICDVSFGHTMDHLGF